MLTVRNACLRIQTGQRSLVLSSAVKLLLGVITSSADSLGSSFRSAPPCLKPGRARLSFRQARGICISNFTTLAAQGWRDAHTRLWRYFYFFLFCQLNEEPRERFAERWEWTFRVCLVVCRQCRAEKCQCSCRHKSQGDSLDEFQCNNLTLPYCSPAFIPALVSKLCWLC